MSSDQAAFDDWEAEAQKIQQKPQEEILEKSVTTEKNDQQKQQTKDAHDPLKVFMAKIEQYQKLSDEEFSDLKQDLHKESTCKIIKGNTFLVKSDKDFVQFAKMVAKKFADVAEGEKDGVLQQNNILTFFEESILYQYRGFQWKNIDNVKDKIKIYKKDRQKIEKQEKKRKEKEQRTRRAQMLQQQNQKKIKIQPKVEQDLFGGAENVNSKQIEDQMKNKVQKEQKVQKKTVVEEDDDDDFM